MNNSVLVILPTLGDRIQMLRETLESVDRQRNDIALTIALVVPKGAQEAISLGEEFGATIVLDPARGISSAINAGLGARSDEKYYAWIGDDDLFLQGGLLKLHVLLESNDNAVLAYGACEYISPSGKLIGTNSSGAAAKFFLPWGPNLIPHPGSMIRLDSLINSGGFDSQLKYAMDLDMFLRLRKYGRFISTREPVSAFRWHPDSLTVSSRRSSTLEAEAIKKKHFPFLLRNIAFLWNYPLRLAAKFVSQRMNATAQKLL